VVSLPAIKILFFLFLFLPPVLLKLFRYLCVLSCPATCCFQVVVLPAVIKNKTAGGDKTLKPQVAKLLLKLTGGEKEHLKAQVEGPL